MKNAGLLSNRQINVKTIHSIQENPQDTAPFNRSPTREMVYARTTELASLAGRMPYEINQHDYERAKRELTGERDFEKQRAILDLNSLF